MSKVTSRALAAAARVGSVTLPGHVYFLTLGCALAVSLAVLLATLPLLNRITVPDEVRFE